MLINSPRALTRCWIAAVVGLCAPLWVGADDKAKDIAYVRLTDGVWQVWVTDDQGQSHRQMTFDVIDKTRVSWLGKGKDLLYNRNDGTLGRVSLKDGVQGVLAFPLSGMLDAHASPDGEWVAFSLSSTQAADNNDLWMVRIDGAEPKKLTSHPGLDQSPSWDRESTSLVYSSGRALKTHDIWRVNIKTGDRTQLTAGSGFNFEPSISSKTDIAYSSDAKGNYDIWVLGKAVEGPRQLTTHPAYDAQPTWSPDGSRMAFHSQRAGRKRIWVKGIKDGDVYPITPEDAESRNPAWRM